MPPSRSTPGIVRRAPRRSLGELVRAERLAFLDRSGRPQDEDLARLIRLGTLDGDGGRVGPAGEGRELHVVVAHDPLTGPGHDPVRVARHEVNPRTTARLKGNAAFRTSRRSGVARPRGDGPRSSGRTT